MFYKTNVPYDFKIFYKVTAIKQCGVGMIGRQVSRTAQ